MASYELGIPGLDLQDEELGGMITTDYSGVFFGERKRTPAFPENPVFAEHGFYARINDIAQRHEGLYDPLRPLVPLHKLPSASELHAPSSELDWKRYVKLEEPRRIHALESPIFAPRELTSQIQYPAGIVGPSVNELFSVDSSHQQTIDDDDDFSQAMLRPSDWLDLIAADESEIKGAPVNDLVRLPQRSQRYPICDEEPGEEKWDTLWSPVFPHETTFVSDLLPSFNPAIEMGDIGIHSFPQGGDFLLENEPIQWNHVAEDERTTAE